MSLTTHGSGGSKVDLPASPPGFSTILEKNSPLRHEYSSNDISAENSAKPYQKLLNPSDLSLPDDSKNPERSKSYAKLAAALGEGLAESMDGSVFEDQKQKSLTSLTFDKYPGDDFSSYFPKVRPLDNYARQSRHIASRLIGSSSSHIAGPDVRLSSFTNGDNLESKLQSDYESSDPFLSYMDTVRMLDTLSSVVVDSDHLKSFTGSSYGRGGVGISVVEPGSTAPTPPILDSWAHGRTSNMSRIFSNLEESRGSISQTPSLYESSQSIVTNSHSPKMQVSSSLPRNMDVRISDDSSFSSLLHSSGISPQTQLPYTNRQPPTNVISTAADLTRTEMERKSIMELSPFIWSSFSHPTQSKGHTYGSDENRPPSRALILFGTRLLDVFDVKSACDLFGALSYFRPEFSKDRGIIFLAYHDIRSSIQAAHEVKQRMEAMVHPRAAVREYLKNSLDVFFSVPLTSSSSVDESILLISNLPATLDEKRFHNMMKSYGMTRSIYFHSDRTDSDGHELVSCTIEFHDILDARQALLELESANQSGSVTFNHRSRTANERKMGRDLLALIAQWRHGDKQGLGFMLNNVPITVPTTINASVPGYSHSREASHSEGSSTPGMFSSDSSRFNHSSSSDSPASIHITQPLNSLQHHMNQVVVGPNGQSFVLVHPHDSPGLVSNIQLAAATYSQPFIPGVPVQPFLNSSNSEYAGFNHDGQPQVWTQSSVPTGNMLHTFQGQSGVMSASGYMNDMPVMPPMPPYYNTRNSSDPTRMHHHINGSTGSTHPASNKKNDPYTNGLNGSLKITERPTLSASPEDDGSMILDINAVKNGADQRTSLMVRNIPNKYTQSMLLAEFSEKEMGSVKIDFFYLPIDFKNKCNRGYAFVNFVDYRDIIPFHNFYHGKSWKMFNSDKKCDITYARIQGKMALMKRFQNSALLEKDAEYRPLVFVSHGEKKGQPEEFSSESS